MPTADARQYELNLYEDASFRPSSKVSTYPMRAQAGQTIYVEVKLNSGKAYTVVNSLRLSDA